MIVTVRRILDEPDPPVALRQAALQLMVHHNQRVAEHVIGKFGATVQAGPFRGLRLPPAAPFILQWLLGCCEAELHPALEAAIAAGYERIVNIGCGLGDYAAGLALRLPRATVYAFDTDPAARTLARETARLNGVADRVIVAGECTPAELARLTTEPGALVLCDCEGCELELLDAAALAGTDVIVELHDFIYPGLAQRLAERFAGTHAVEIIRAGGRDPHAYPALADLGEPFKWIAVWENRPVPGLWAVMRAPKLT
jgi:hypothetical protein